MSIIRLTMPEPKITLYEDGFKDNCKLGRVATGGKVSELLERVDEPLVIALDGAWGSGKSFFLKCWVGEHLKRADTNSQTVYFDAFQHDYLDDPLVALTLELTKRFESEGEVTPKQQQERIEKLKRAAWAVGKGAARIGLSAATFGATEILNDVGDEIAKAAGKEAEKFLESGKGKEQIDDFWATQRARSAAMDAFRLALIALTEPNDDASPTKKLIVVIDELDRCRPDYALSLLEIIKHFFAVPGVHFILGANISELKNSIRARYGDGVDADIYLQKFISLSMTLPATTEIRTVEEEFWGMLGQDLGLNKEIWETALQVIKACKDQQLVSLRSLQRFASHLMLLPQRRWNEGDQILVVSSAFLKVHAPTKYAALRNGTLSLSDLYDIFTPDNPYLQTAWTEGLDRNQHTKDTRGFLPGLFGPYSNGDDEGLMTYLTNFYLETFSLPAQRD